MQTGIGPVAFSQHIKSSQDRADYLLIADKLLHGFLQIEAAQFRDSEVQGCMTIRWIGDISHSLTGKLYDARGVPTLLLQPYPEPRNAKHIGILRQHRMGGTQDGYIAPHAACDSVQCACP